MGTNIGAFAAGPLLLDTQFSPWGDHRRHKYTIKELFAPLEAILVPVFFVLMGLQVKLETFLHWNLVFLATGLTVVAILGKLASGLGALGRLNRLAIGIGMMPRGEVGLVFASIGKTLGVIGPPMFSAVVLMVIVTTLATPPLLKTVMKKHEGPPGDGTGKARLSKLCE